MRSDSIGMFWQDLPTSKGGSHLARVMPPIPDTGWTPPREFPNLRNARALGIDTETKELDFDHGPGWARGKGHIVGISVATDDGHRWYFPMRHEVEPEHNLNPDHVLAWARDTLALPMPKVGAHLGYDVGWLTYEGVPVRGPFIDVQFGEALLEERGHVDLDTLGVKYLGAGKETNWLYQWCADYYGGEANGKQRANIYRAPPRLVGPYAEQDAVMPLRVAEHQFPRLAAENLLSVFDMECRLIPLLVAMRLQGVRVDIGKAEQLRDELLRRAQAAQQHLNQLANAHVDVNKAKSIALAFDAAGLAYNRTAAGAPSFTKVFLKNTHNPVAEAINEIRKLEKLRGTFLESYILESHVNERIFCQFHPLRGNDNGTRSGRLSSSTPNLQNIPARDEELAPLIRGMFLPEPGDKGWLKLDYSQIEYRFLVHYAVGAGADEARARYNADPDTDYHDFVIEMIRMLTAVELARRPAKNMNFGLIFGMGKAKLIRELGVNRKKGTVLFDAYHTAIPYAKATMEACADEATRSGIVETILGRRSRFDLWSPRGYQTGKRIALPYERAFQLYGDVERAHLHKALNRKLQGSAADLMKKAMVEAWDAGVFDYTGVPRLTVHDELGFSDPGTAASDEAFAELRRIMESCIALRVPVRVDQETGPDWGHVAKT